MKNCDQSKTFALRRSQSVDCINTKEQKILKSELKLLQYLMYSLIYYMCAKVNCTLPFFFFFFFFKETRN